MNRTTELSAVRTGSGRLSLVDLVKDRFVYAVILAWCILGVIQLAAGQLPLLFLHQSIGNGDSYIFSSVEEFRKTGLIYPPLGPAHLTPVLYSPLLYLMHYVAWILVLATNPYLGPRIAELFWFLACLGMAGALSRRFVRARSTMTIAALLGASYTLVVPWVLQLRADFPGIACSLLAVWFLISNRRHSAVLAGMSAGLALQFKITFISAAAAGFLWLLLHRRWRELSEFAASAALFSAGLYILISWREPFMFGQILMLGRMIPHPAGVVTFIRQIVSEPASLLAVAGMIPVLISMVRRQRPRFQLLFLYLTVSLAMGLYTSLQAGANSNYFYETLFAATPFGVLALLQIRARQAGSAGIMLGFLLFTTEVMPRAAAVTREIHSRLRDVGDRNRAYDNLRDALRGARVLSSIPDVTILTPERTITDSILLNYLSLTRGTDLSDLIGRIHSRSFDAIVTQPATYSWRGVAALESRVRAAVMESYQPYCLYNDMLVHMPASGGSTLLASKLRAIGCQPVHCGPGLQCPGLSVSVETF